MVCIVLLSEIEKFIFVYSISLLIKSLIDWSLCENDKRMFYVFRFDLYEMRAVDWPRAAWEIQSLDIFLFLEINQKRLNYSVFIRVEQSEWDQNISVLASS